MLSAKEQTYLLEKQVCGLNFTQQQALRIQLNPHWYTDRWGEATGAVVVDLDQPVVVGVNLKGVEVGEEQELPRVSLVGLGVFENKYVVSENEQSKISPIPQYLLSPLMGNANEAAKATS